MLSCKTSKTHCEAHDMNRVIRRILILTLVGGITGCKNTRLVGKCRKRFGLYVSGLIRFKLTRFPNC